MKVRSSRKTDIITRGKGRENRYLYDSAMQSYISQGNIGHTIGVSDIIIYENRIAYLIHEGSRERLVMDALYDEDTVQEGSGTDPQQKDGE